MDGVQLLFKLKKLVELRRDDVVNGMITGVDNFEKYQYMLGQVQDTLEKQQVASQCGNVLAMGADCYRDKNRYKQGPWCKVGDWVMFARYAGSRIKIEGGEVRLLNDDEILATIKNPEDILHEY
jgi:co-chaperonin GroES (HSP10)